MKWPQAPPQKKRPRKKYKESQTRKKVSCDHTAILSTEDEKDDIEQISKKSKFYVSQEPRAS